MRYLLALDQGTTSSRTLLFDERFRVAAASQREFPQLFPKPGWVEHDPEAIWQSQSATLKNVVSKSRVDLKSIAAVGITNQRETLVAWDKKTGHALAPALVWQDRRTASACDALRRQGHESWVRRKTGLLFDPYFSGTKMQWLLHHHAGVKKAARAGTLAFGTIDSWLIHKLTGGRRHVTDVSNASRTLLFNLKTLSWDEELLDLFGIPHECLPEILPSDGDFGETTLPYLSGIPIRGVLGDQQAALFGHRCFEVGEAKNTYGTGCFLLRQVGSKPPIAAKDLPKGILGTVAWQAEGRIAYAHEGAVLVGGAAIQFLRDGLGLIAHASESEALARQLNGNDGVYFVPAFAGLGTPHWDPDARGLIIGLTRGTTQAHLARAALESIAYQSADLCAAFGSRGIKRLRADGGATSNTFLMQFQADMLGVPVEVSGQPEMTALGAAMMAAVGSGETTMGALRKVALPGKVYRPAVTSKLRQTRLAEWREAVRRSQGWARFVGG
jgi:glycerol kinase